MILKRYEILLPLTYNDGSEIEKEKFELTNEELLTVESFESPVHSSAFDPHNGMLF